MPTLYACIYRTAALHNNSKKEKYVIWNAAMHLINPHETLTRFSLQQHGLNLHVRREVDNVTQWSSNLLGYL